jgi:hypothetical protein
LTEEVRLRESTVELKNKYIDQLEGNKVLVDAIQEYKRRIAVQEETIQALRATIKVDDELLELNKKDRNPNRVVGGKRGRPKGSKSKAV